MDKERKISVGDKLWFVPAYGNERASHVEIKKVGRKWAETVFGRKIEMDTLKVVLPNYGTVGQCYFNKEEYEQEIALQKAWARFLRDVYNSGLKPLTTMEGIEKARELLRLPQVNKSA